MTFLQQVQVPLGSLPLVMLCLSNGTVVFVPSSLIGVLWCPVLTGVNAYLLKDHFSLYAEGTEGSVEFEYQRMYNYKDHPLLLQWLQELNLQNPFTGEFRNTAKETNESSI